MDNVVAFPGTEKTVAAVLDAVPKDAAGVVVLAVTAEGEEYVDVTGMSNAQAAWLAQRLIARLVATYG